MNGETDRLLGQLAAEVRSLHQRIDWIESYQKEMRTRQEAELTKIRHDLDVLKSYMQEVQGGKKALFTMLAAATALGGFLWEILSRIVQFK